MEKWKEIKGYEGLYEVSTEGNIRSIKTGKIRKPRKSFGYLRINLCKNNIVKYHLVHTLVAKTFLPNNNPELLTQVNHKNEIKDDNRVENLEWCTPKYNTNYGTARERMINTQISTGYLNPKMIGLDRKTYARLYMRQYRKRKRLGL